MNRKIHLCAIGLASVVFASTFCSCEKENTVEDTSNSSDLIGINQQFVENTVVPTYDSLASSTMKLYATIKALKTNKTDANVATAAAQWKLTRAYWEESEAFLFGPVEAMGIDPHIDTWPMSETAFAALMSGGTISSYDTDDGDVAVSTNDPEDGLLGFHSIEYILFRNGAVRSASAITDDELIYALAVAGDLRNQCCLIEVGWLGTTAVSTTKWNYAKRVDNYSQLTANYASTSYLSLMEATPNTTYTSALDATLAILDGCIDIADEVANTKIGSPYTGDDANYIESKYSYNSTTDFAGNIRSVQYAYFGGRGNTSPSTTSVSAYLKTVNSTLDTEVKTAIANTIAKIEAIENFETNTQSTSTKAAMDACNELYSLLVEAKAALQK